MLKKIITQIFPELLEMPPSPIHTAATKPPGRTARPAPPAAVKASKQRAQRLTLGDYGHGKLGPVEPFSIPFKLENRHFLIAGAPGSGKTRLFFQIADQVRERGDKAFVIDHGGEQIMRQWQPGDIILNPHDARWPGWSPFCECIEPWDFDAMGKLIIPDATGSGAEWNRYAQQLVTAVLKKIGEDESGVTNRTNADLIKYAVALEFDALRAFLADDPIAGMLAPKNEKMVGSIRGIVSSYLAPWRYLNDQGDDGGQFSIRDWITNDDDKRWVFVTYKESQFGAMRSLMSCWLSLAVTYALDLHEDENRRFWFFLDELGSLDKIDALSDALAKVRKRGGCCLIGLQALSQLEETNGEMGARNLLSCCGTWIALKVGDAKTAQEFEAHFGKQWIWQEGYNEGVNHGGDKATLSDGASLQLQQKVVIDYTDIKNSEDLHGYIRFPGDLPVGEIVCPISPPPPDRGAEAYIARKRTRVAGKTEEFDLELGASK